MNRVAKLAAAGAASAYFAYRRFWPGYRFQDKNVVITGGSRGLGLVLARQLARRGARLAICARDPDELAVAYDELVQDGTRVVAAECDLKDPARIREFIAVARQRLGPIDVLINNAGIIGVGPLEEQTLGDFELAMQTHFWATVHTCLEVIPEMKARGCGRIVNISSFGGKVAVPHLLPYTASKFAVTGFSSGLRAELAEHGIVVITVCPGLMRTGSHLHAEFKGQNEKEYRWFSIGNAIPGFSISAESAARKIIRGVELGDAEILFTLPAKAAVLVNAIFPGLISAAMKAANRFVLPEPGGVGPQSMKGYASRKATPSTLTTLSDTASARNNELHSGIPSPPPLPVAGQAAAS
jgi:short-subunit dehydrogenase